MDAKELRPIGRYYLALGLLKLAEAAATVVSTLICLLRAVPMAEVVWLIGIHYTANLFFTVVLETMPRDWMWKESVKIALIVLLTGLYMNVSLLGFWPGVIAEVITGLGMALWENAIKAKYLGEAE